MMVSLPHRIMTSDMPVQTWFCWCVVSSDHYDGHHNAPSQSSNRKVSEVRVPVLTTTSPLPKGTEPVLSLLPCYCGLVFCRLGGYEESSSETSAHLGKKDDDQETLTSSPLNRETLDLSRHRQV